MRLTRKSDELNPIRPKRTAAHTKSGRGRYIMVGAVAGDGGNGPNTQKPIRTVATISRADSRNRAALILPFRTAFRVLRSTMGGTIVRTAIAFVKNRSIPRCQ